MHVGAARGYMQPAPLEGLRPAIHDLNLKSTTMWPRYKLATVTALGGKFDLAGYDDAVSTTGGVPLELLKGKIDRYIASMV